MPGGWRVPLRFWVDPPKPPSPRGRTLFPLRFWKVASLDAGQLLGWLVAWLLACFKRDALKQKAPTSLGLFEPGVLSLFLGSKLGSGCLPDHHLRLRTNTQSAGNQAKRKL